MEFIFNVASKIIFASGARKKAGEFLKEQNVKKILLVYDPNLERIGIIKEIVETIKEVGIEVVSFNKIQPDPSYKLVNEAADLAKKENVDAIVGVGGGSSMDTAKCANVLLTNEGTILDYAVAYDTVPKKGKYLILIPTTFGTASEITDGGVLSVPERKKKVTVWGKNLGGDIALVDPDIAVGLPPSITASTGMDALSHAVEAYTTILVNPITDAIALKAIEIILKYLPVCMKDSKNIEARSQMCVGCLMAGMAFNNAFLSQGHALAHVLGARHHIPHGTACALSLPLVIQSNTDSIPERIIDLGKAFGVKTDGLKADEAAAEIKNRIIALCDDLKILNLKESGVTKDDFEDIATGFDEEPDKEYFYYVPTQQDILDYLESIY